MFDITLEGADKLISNIANVSNIIRDEMKKAMTACAVDAERFARAQAPHDTGALRSAIHYEPAVVTSNNVISKVGVNRAIKYARAQEFGTQGMVIHSHSSKGKQFTYIGNIRPKWYMRDAKIKVQPIIKARVTQAGRNIVKGLAK